MKPLLRPTWTVVLLFAATGGCGHAPTPAEAPVYLGGIKIHEPDHQAWFTALKKAGLNTVEATVYAKQGDWDSAHLWWSNEAPGIEAEIREAKAAGMRVVLILRVELEHAYPKNRFLWHGMISPRTPASLAAWFVAYEAFVSQWAERAETLGVDVLAIGSEMSALTSTRPRTALPELLRFYFEEDERRRYRKELLRFRESIQTRHLAAAGGGGFSDLTSFVLERSEAWHAWAIVEVDPTGEPGEAGEPEEPGGLEGLNTRRAELERNWRTLIARVRTLFSGTLTYAANFDQYQEVGFWDALDLIGINAYFRLRDPEILAPATADNLHAGWTHVLTEIERFRHDHNLETHRVLFTELGYVARKNCTLQPWSQAGFDVLGPESNRKLYIWEDQPPDRTERARAVRALSRALTGFPGLFAGALYWKLSTQGEHEAIEPFVVVLGIPEDPTVHALISLRQSPR